MTPSPRPSRRPARWALALAAAGAGIALAGSASGASAACTAPATDAPAGKCQITFTASGSWTVPADVTKADVVVVGGGGGAWGRSGGGGGTVVVESGYAVTPGSAVAVTVGAGALGTAIDQYGVNLAGDNAGAASSFGSVTAKGGSSPTLAAIAGGASGTYAGGANVTQAGGGGAGAGGNGISASGSGAGEKCGAGGPGQDVSGVIVGLASSVFGGGGGGGTASPSTTPGCAGGAGGGGTGAANAVTAATAGAANTGGGAGAGTADAAGYASSGGTGAAGGSGVVVVQYGPDAPAQAGATLTASVLGQRQMATGTYGRLAIRTANTGKVPVTYVRSCITIPANLALTSAAGGTRTRNDVCFAVGTLAPGAQVTKTISVRASAAQRVTRSVAGKTVGAETSLVTATPARVTIFPIPSRRPVGRNVVPAGKAPTLRASIVTFSSSVVAGQGMFIGIGVSNSGKVVASSVNACITFPANLVPISSARWTRSKGAYCYAVGTLNPGASSLSRLMVRALGKGGYTETVTGSVSAIGRVVTPAPKQVTIRRRG